MTSANQTIPLQPHPYEVVNNKGIQLEIHLDFNKIVQLYSSLLFASVIHLTRNKQISEDIVQDTFLKLWEKRIELKNDNIGGWLYKVACNQAYKHLRRESFKAKMHASFLSEKQNSYTEVEERLLQKENMGFYAKAYSKLPEKQQAVYLLSNEEGLTRREIADHLNISPNTVKNHLARAVQFIRENIRCACFFFILFISSVFNNIFFTVGSTKVELRDLYHIQQRTNINQRMEINKRYHFSYSTSFMETTTLNIRSLKSI